MAVVVVDTDIKCCECALIEKTGIFNNSNGEGNSATQISDPIPTTNSTSADGEKYSANQISADIDAVHSIVASSNAG